MIQGFEHFVLGEVVAVGMCVGHGGCWIAIDHFADIDFDFTTGDIAVKRFSGFDGHEGYAVSDSFLMLGKLPTAVKVLQARSGLFLACIRLLSPLAFSVTMHAAGNGSLSLELADPTAAPRTARAVGRPPGPPKSLSA